MLGTNYQREAPAGWLTDILLDTTDTGSDYLAGSGWVVVADRQGTAVLALPVFALMPLFPRLELCLAGGRFCAPDSLRTDGNDQGGPGRRAVVGVGAAVALAKELEKELACRESTHYCARLLPHSLTSSSTDRKSVV